MTNVEKKIEEFGLKLIPPPPPLGAFRAVNKFKDILYVSGHTSILKGVDETVGIVGSDISIDQAYHGAKIAALRCVSALAQVEDLDKLQIIKLSGFVNAVSGFTEHIAVLNGASDFLNTIFAEKGPHARYAIGVNSLPGNASVEIDLIVGIL